MRKKLQIQIIQLQKEIQDIWNLQQEKENKLHTLQQELIKDASPIADAMSNSKLAENKEHKHHHHRHHHHHKAP